MGNAPAGTGKSKNSRRASIFHTPSFHVREPLNKSTSAEQRIFFPGCAVSKVGNTYSIPPLLKPSSSEKSFAVSSCRFIQSFLKSRPRLCRNHLGSLILSGRLFLLVKLSNASISSNNLCFNSCKLQMF